MPTFQSFIYKISVPVVSQDVSSNVSTKSTKLHISVVVIFLFSLRDEELLPFAEDVSSDEENQHDRYCIIMKGTNKGQRCLVDRTGYKYTERQTTSLKVRYLTKHFCNASNMI